MNHAALGPHNLRGYGTRWNSWIVEFDDMTCIDSRDGNEARRGDARTNQRGEARLGQPRLASPRLASKES